MTRTGWLAGWMAGWPDGWMAGWLDGQMAGWPDGQAGRQADVAVLGEKIFLMRPSL